MINVNFKIRTAIAVLIFICFCNKCLSQINLVPNYSFETYTGCPNQNTSAYINLATPWYSPVSDPSYYAVYANACAPANSCCSVPYQAYGHLFQYARTGNAFAAMYFKHVSGNGRNYIQVKLLQKLQPSKCYYVEFFVNAPKNNWGGGGAGINNIGLLITDTAIQAHPNQPPLATNFGLINANPQIVNYGNPVVTDTVNWVKIAGVYTATGGEKYITIGNFKDDAHTTQVVYYPNSTSAGYNIDDVSVIPLDSMFLKADAGRDTVIHPGDSVFIGSLLCGLTTQWFNAQGVNIANNVPGLWVKPTANTYYILEQNNCGQLSKDTVNITVTPLPVTLVNYALHQQNNSIINTWQTATEVNVSHFNIQRSSSGNAKDFQTIGTLPSKGIGKYEWADNNTPLSLGRGAGGEALFYRLETVDKDGERMYSDIKKITLTTNHSPLITIKPNPAKDFITIEGKDIQQISIMDALGRLVKRIVPFASSTQIEVKDWTKGVYWIKASNKEGKTVTNKLVVGN